MGSVLSASAGAWDPGQVQTEYRWIVDGERLPGAAEPTLTVDEKLLGHRIKVRVIASQLGYATAKATSPATPEILPGTLASTTAPVISGDSTVDETLSVTSGGWYPAPDAVSYRWLADGSPIDGARSDELSLTPALEGTTVTAEVTATRDGYDAVTVESAPRTVAPGTLTLTREAALAGHSRPGERLLVTLPETAQTSEATVRWLRDGAPLAGVTGTTYDLTADDLGSRITAEITLQRAGYTPATRSVESDRVRAPADVELRAERRGKRGGKVRLDVLTNAIGVNPVPGLVRIRSLGTTTTKDLRDGSARLTLRDVPKRSFRIKVIQPGSATTERGVEIVRVRRG